MCWTDVDSQGCTTTMNAGNEQFVPKVNPATREVLPDDSMTLHATTVCSGSGVRHCCVVQEYAWIGFDTQQIFGLFRQPMCPALSELLEFCGEAGIRERIGQVLGRSGVLRFAEILNEFATPGEELE